MEASPRFVVCKFYDCAIDYSNFQPDTNNCGGECPGWSVNRLVRFSPREWPGAVMCLCVTGSRNALTRHSHESGVDVGRRLGRSHRGSFVWLQVQRSTKFSPFQLLYGVKPRLPIDLLDADDCTPDDNFADERMERATEFACGLAEVRKKATENLTAAQAKQKSCYDVKHAPVATNVQGWHTVLKYNRRRNTRMGDKLQARYTGPFQISEVLGRGVYRLKDGDVDMKQAVNATNLPEAAGGLCLYILCSNSLCVVLLSAIEMLILKMRAIS